MRAAAIVLLFTALALLLSVNGEEVVAYINFEGSSTAFCPVFSCSSSDWFPNRACNSDPAAWEDGARTFEDPVPPGNVVRSVSVVYYINANNCSDVPPARERLVTLDGSMVGFTPDLVRE